MSVGRDVIADVCGVEEEDVRCETCVGFSGHLWCEAWEQPTRAEDFCSFWQKKGGDTE